ncbi:hypothetical protein CDAR_38441 [Caerostris darwini]|uniref:Uncharacterized protein n=1 Tax=Caerostris darwini TaxID=1538125 RepID=A0AAV4T0A7_9ARAC|nr:hypothetical protein CDAR_38441 [Caerostris darwini]
MLRSYFLHQKTEPRFCHPIRSSNRQMTHRLLKKKKPPVLVSIEDQNAEVITSFIDSEFGNRLILTYQDLMLFLKDKELNFFKTTPKFLKPIKAALNCIIDLIESPTCINCGKQCHLASWKGCIMFPKATKSPPKRFHSNPIDDRITFADYPPKTNLQIPQENIPSTRSFLL